MLVTLPYQAKGQLSQQRADRGGKRGCLYVVCQRLLPGCTTGDPEWRALSQKGVFVVESEGCVALHDA